MAPAIRFALRRMGGEVRDVADNTDVKERAVRGLTINRETKATDQRWRPAQPMGVVAADSPSSQTTWPGRLEQRDRGFRQSCWPVWSWYKPVTWSAEGGKPTADSQPTIQVLRDDLVASGQERGLQVAVS